MPRVSQGVLGKGPMGQQCCTSALHCAGSLAFPGVFHGYIWTKSEVSFDARLSQGHHHIWSSANPNLSCNQKKSGYKRSPLVPQFPNFIKFSIIFFLWFFISRGQNATISLYLLNYYLKPFKKKTNEQMNK